MAIFKSVEYREVSITASSEPVTLNLTKGQDEAQCVPFFSQRTAGAITDQWHDRMGEVEIIDNAGTAAVRVSASARVDDDANVFQIFIVEFDASINVQQIDVADFTGTSKTVTVTDVTAQADAFFIYSYQSTNIQASDDDWNDAMIRGHFDGSSTTSIILARAASGGDMNGTLYVVDCDSSEWTVNHVEWGPGSGNNDSNQAIGATVVEADTFLIPSWQVSEGGDDMRDGQFQFDLLNTTTIKARRTVGATPNAAATFNVQVVECNNNEWDVQRNDALTLGSASVTDSITAIDQARSFINTLGHSGHPASVGRNDSTNGNLIDETMSAADFSTDSLVRYRMRTATITDSIVSYEVVQFASVAGDETLTGDPSQLLFTGADAALAQLLSSAPGALQLTGADADLAYALASTPGALVLTGADAALAQTLTSDPGALILTGASAALTRGFAGDPGALLFTGADAALALGLVGDAGALIFTGAEATLSQSRLLAADPGALVLTGSTAALAVALAAAEGTLLLTGSEATLRIARLLQADPAALQFTGADASLALGLASAPGLLLLTGAEADLLDSGAGQVVTGDPGALLLTGSEADLLDSTPALVVRRGGVRWLREDDPAKREQKTQELTALIKPKMPAKSSARQPQEPQEPLLTAVQAATTRMSRAQQLRTDRLLQETGISIEELLILLQ